MDLGLTGKTALVTGSTAGIGLAIAEGLAREGAHVIITGRTQSRVDSALKELKDKVKEANATGLAVDLGTADGGRSVMEKVSDVDILVNNVATFGIVPFEEITDEAWEKIFQVNFFGAVRLCRFYFPKMLKKNWGRIIFISSESGVNIPVEMIHYGVTKTAQLSLSRGLAELTAGTNVTVNSVLPGPTMSEGVNDFLADMAKSQNKTTEQVQTDFFKNARPSSLIKRFATVEEVANMVVYVASEAASATNGAALRVDGGVVRSIT